MRRLWVMLGVFGALQGGMAATDRPAAAQMQDPPVHECDLLAAEPGSVPGVAGVALEALDGAAASAACAQALGANPGAARFLHQYARALERMGDAEAAARLYQWASRDGFEPAGRALARLEGGPEPLEPVALSVAFADPVRLLGIDRAAALARPGFGPLAAPPGPPEEVDPLALSRRAAALADGLPATATDLDALAGSFGGDPLAAYAFVAESIRYEAYPGALRGAAGTLDARAGNAADQSLLLQALLRRMGVETRIATGTLDEAAAARLYDRMFERGDGQGGAGLTTAEAAGDLEPGGLLDRVRSRAARDYAVLRPALGDRLGAVSTADRSAIETEIRGHVWVRAALDGAWIDLDPAFGEAPGTAAAEVETSEPALPEEAYQLLAIRIVEERDGGGYLAERALVEQRLPVTDLRSEQVFVLFQPESGLAAMGAGLGSAISGALGALDDAPVEAGAELWRPVLWIGGEGYGGDAIAVDDGLVGLWLEFELQLPGGGWEVSRRALLDRVPTPDRLSGWLTADLEPLQRTEEGPVPLLALHNVWISSGPANLGDFAEATGMLGALAIALLEGEVGQEDLAPEVALWTIALGNAMLPILSDHLVVPAVNDRADLRLYAPGPRIAIFTIGPDPALGPDGRYAEIDLHRDTLRVVAATDAPSLAAAERQLWFGLLQGALETEVLWTRSAVSDPQAREPDAASGLLAGAVVLFGPGDEAALEDAARDPEASALLAAALARGALVAVPMAALDGGPVAWWEIALEGGATRAMLAPELGGGRVSYRVSRGAEGASTRHLPPGRGTGSIVSGNPGGVYHVSPDGTSRRIVPGGGSGPSRAGRMAPRGGRALGGELGSYITLVMNIAIPNSVAYAVLGAEVAATVIAIVAILASG